jgi:hypothetical protein
VHEVTEGGVMLRISGIDAARYPDFDPANFVAPDAGWQPPHPYTHADVLLDLGRAEAARADLQPAPSGQALAVERGPEGAPLWQQLSRGMPVLFRDRAGGPLPKDTVIPLDWVRRIDELGVFVDVGAEQLAALPAYTQPPSGAEPTNPG